MRNAELLNTINNIIGSNPFEDTINPDNYHGSRIPKLCFAHGDQHSGKHDGGSGSNHPLDGHKNKGEVTEGGITRPPVKHRDLQDTPGQHIPNGRVNQNPGRTDPYPGQ